MPKRTIEQRELIDSLPELKASEKCNARTGNFERPYCQMKAGFRTDHPGTGRCYLHGGRAGMPIITGEYSKKLTSTLQEEYEKIVNDPLMLNMTAELAIMKTIFGDLLKRIGDDIASNKDVWVEYTSKGTPVVSTAVKSLMGMMDTMSRMYQRIVDAEAKSAEQLTLKQIYAVVSQIKNAMAVCGDCPIRSIVGNKLQGIKIANMSEN